MRRPASILAAFVLVAGCAASPSAPPAPVDPRSPPPGASPAATGAGPVTTVAGSAVCRTFGGVRWVGGGTEVVEHFTSIVQECDVALSDPRASGAGGLRMDAEHVRLARDQWDFYGVLTIANEAGSWEGGIRGSASGEGRVAAFTASLAGSGAYAGLELRLTWTPRARLTGGDTFATFEPRHDLAGVIVPAGAPGAFDAFATCAYEGEWVLPRRAGGAHGRVDRCAATSADPRVTGRLKVWLESVQEAVAPGPAHGTAVLESGAGSWTGSINAIRADDGEQRIAWTALGTGAYEGRILEARVVEDPDGSTRLSGTVSPAGPMTVTGTLAAPVSANPGLEALLRVGTGADVEVRAESRATESRLDGPAVLTFRGDPPAGDATGTWGTLVIEREAGRWAGSWEAEPGAEADGFAALRGTLRGTGDADLWTLDYRLTSANGATWNLVGTLVPRFPLEPLHRWVCAGCGEIPCPSACPGQ